MTFSPCPKPPRSSPKQRRALPRPTKPIVKFNKKRQAKEMTRKYGSSHRRRFIRSLPCSACGAEGFSQNAHVGREGAGAGRKANADQVAPLCGPRYVLVFNAESKRKNGVEGVVGCHALHDQHRDKFFARFPWYNPSVICAETERAYQAFCLAEQEMSA